MKKLGYSLVTEKTDNCLSIFDPQGSKIHTVENLNYPRCVVLDPMTESVYVLNGGHRSEVWKYCM